MGVKFRKGKMSDLENFPRINRVELSESMGGETLLEVTPNTIEDSDIEAIGSILKSVVPNYIISSNPEEIAVIVYYEKETNTYKLYAMETSSTLQEDTYLLDEPMDIEDIGPEYRSIFDISDGGTDEN